MDTKILRSFYKEINFFPKIEVQKSPPMLIPLIGSDTHCANKDCGQPFSPYRKRIEGSRLCGDCYGSTSRKNLPKRIAEVEAPDLRKSWMSPTWEEDSW